RVRGGRAAAGPPGGRRRRGGGREPFCERERVVDGLEPEYQYLRQAAPIAEASRDVDRLTRERVAPLTVRRVLQLARQLAEHTGAEQAVGRTQRRARLLVEGKQGLVHDVGVCRGPPRAPPRERGQCQALGIAQPPPPP